MKRLLVLLYLLASGCLQAPLTPYDVPELPVESVLYFQGKTLEGGYRGCSLVAIEPGTALTAAHCVRDLQAANVQTYTRRHWDVAAWEAHPNRDIAVLHVAGPNGMPVADVAQDLPEIGDLVYLVGYGCPSYDPKLPMVRPGTWTGQIDFVDSEWAVLGPVCPGDSGGGLFNEDGELLGIITSKGPGIAYVVPAGYAGELLD